METELLKADESAYKKAADLLLKGEVVGVPTETVYGLAADALNPQAVKKIFEAKGRPQDNPLIVHIAKWDQLPLVASEIPEAAVRLGKAFWPGPLTMIMKKSEKIPMCVTAGLETVGIRMPSHPSAARIIELSTPLAAPSANTSGKPSPTAASHVYNDMKGKIPLIVDGGSSSVGVESTVVDMTGEIPKVLRPGAITEEMIAEVLGSASTDIATKVGLAKGEKAKAPGMKYRHYAPNAPVILYEGTPEDTFTAVMAAHKDGDGIICFDEYKSEFEKMGFENICTLGPSWDHGSHGRRLFAVLRGFDSTDVKRILAQCPREFGAGEGTVNRMRKSAGFVCTKCTEKNLVGVTGMSGAGKSLFCSLVKEHGKDIRIIDADKVYHGLLSDLESSLTSEILGEFPEAASSDGRVDRDILGSIVFSSRKKLDALNAISHRAVLKAMLREASDCPEHTVIMDTPLLFESGLDRHCTMTVGLAADRSCAKSRILARDNIPEEKADMRLANQADESFYASHCDFIIRNDGNLKDAEKAALSFIEKYL